MAGADAGFSYGQGYPSFGGVEAQFQALTWEPASDLFRPSETWVPFVFVIFNHLMNVEMKT